MVKDTEVKQSNAHFANRNHGGLVCVFTGATSGIGASTLQKMVTMFSSTTFYVLGRSAAAFAKHRSTFTGIGPDCKIIFLEAEVSLLSSVDLACEQITAAETKVDLLYMSQGIYPSPEPAFTQEGLETCFALSYYSRMRLTLNLLPLLRNAPNPRVLTVLSGGREKIMREEDIGLKQHWSSTAVINHTTTMTSLALEHLAKNERRLTFLHVFPGLVKTDIIANLTAPESSGLWIRFQVLIMRSLVALLMVFIGVSPKDSGERQAYHLTSESYRPGAWLVGPTSDVIPPNSALEMYQERGWTEKIWEHTIGIFQSALISGDNSIRQ